MNYYKSLNKQVFSSGRYSIVPIQSKDRFNIMKWRNEQMYHLRQNKVLLKEDQDIYFSEVVSQIFAEKTPNQILFSYLEDDVCIGYGGLVHINWIDKNAEVSFIMATALEESSFEFHWETYLDLIKAVAFTELAFKKIFTYAYDIRPRLFPSLVKSGFSHEATLKEHCLLGGKFVDVLIHSCNTQFSLENAVENDLDLTYKWATDHKIRAFAFSKEIIRYNDHKVWFLAKLASKDSHLFIFENSFKVKLGSIRIDLSENGSWVISYLIDSYYHGRGLGSQLLSLLEDKVKKLKLKGELVGFVEYNNLASVMTFRKLGYVEEKCNNAFMFIKKI